jgi:general stress protein 26
MGIATATIEMRSPEEHRERLHDLVKATRTVVVLASGTPADAEPIDGRPMALVRTDDDTTMYLATSLEVRPGEAERSHRITLVLQGAGYALFSADARITRDRALIHELWSEAWRPWSRGRSDPSLAIVVVAPIEGSYWEGTDRHAYVYRLVDDAPADPAG